MKSSKLLAKGFTLIELLIVIAIIGILSSVVLASLSKSRVSATDAKRKNDLRQINLAINLFYDTYGRMPKNYNCNVSYCPGGGGNYGACEAAVPGVPGGSTTNLIPAAFNASMQELVDAGFLAEIPHSNGGPGYCYYDFGTGGSYAGALLMTELESGNPTVNGVSPSCRPWTSSGVTWCEQVSSMQYCYCNPY